MLRNLPGNHLCALFAALLFLASSPAQAAPSGWRYDGSGVYPVAKSDGDGKHLPMKLGSWSNGSPVPAADVVFVAEEPANLVCVDAKSGKVRWRRSNEFLDTVSGIGRASAEQARDKAVEIREQIRILRVEHNRLRRAMRSGKNQKEQQEKLQASMQEMSALKRALDGQEHLLPLAPMNIIGYSSSTPVFDGVRVYALFGNSAAAAYDVNGERVWALWLGQERREMQGNPFGHAASPLRVGELVVLPYGELRAVQAATGEQVWKSDFYGDFGTPAVMRVDGQDLLVLPSGKLVDASTGNVLLRDLPKLLYNAPLVAGDMLYYTGSHQDPLNVGGVYSEAQAVRIVRTDTGKWAWKRVWMSRLEKDRYYATPLLSGEKLWALSQKGALTTLDPVRGKVLARAQFEHYCGSFYASPMAVNQLIYLVNSSGLVRVADQEGKILSKLEIHDTVWSSPAAGGGYIWVRGYDALHRFSIPSP